MTEKMEQARRPKRFILRKLAVTAVIMALAVVLAMGANAATGGELYEATIGKLVCTLSTDDGGKAELYVDEDGSFTIVEQHDDEAAESSGDVVCARTYEVEIDDDGHVTMNGDVSSVPADGEAVESEQAPATDK